MDFKLRIQEYLDQINPDFKRNQIRVYKPLLQQIVDLLIADNDMAIVQRSQEWQTLLAGIEQVNLTKSEVANHFSLVADLSATGIGVGRAILAGKLERLTPSNRKVDHGHARAIVDMWSNHPDADNEISVQRMRNNNLAFLYHWPNRGFLNVSKEQATLVPITGKPIEIDISNGASWYFAVRCSYWFLTWLVYQNELIAEGNNGQ